MGRLAVLVGLPASGKSMLARKLSENSNYIILSSDKLREELYGDVNDQSHNTEVFEELNRRTSILINEGHDVIYDATNLSRKRRMHLINQVAKNADEKIAYYLHARFADAIMRDELRSRTVGAGVIKKMYKNVHIPLKGEGFTEVIYIPNVKATEVHNQRQTIEKYILKRGAAAHDDLFDFLAEFAVKEFDYIYNLPHDSSYHKFSVSRHTYWVYRWILDNYNGEDKIMMLWAALLHDIGKYFCKSFIDYKGNEQKHASFIGHEYVSSQIAFQRLAQLGYDQDFIEQTCALIQTHMMLYNDGGLAKVTKLLGPELTAKLILLNTADRAAH